MSRANQRPNGPRLVPPRPITRNVPPGVRWVAGSILAVTLGLLLWAIVATAILAVL